MSGEAPAPTPSQTVGPFYGYALPFPQGGDLAPAGHPDTVTVHGWVYDGAGQPVPDALIEVWQPAPTAPGTAPPVRCAATRSPGRSWGATDWSSPASGASPPTRTDTT